MVTRPQGNHRNNLNVYLLANVYTHSGLLGRDAVWCCTPSIDVLEEFTPPVSTMFLGNLVTTYKLTWRHNPEDHHGHLHRHENNTSGKGMNVVCSGTEEQSGASSF
jgi:hypothetical protein